MASSTNTHIVLLGYSGHGLVVAEAALAAGMNLKYYAEKQPATSNPFGLQYLGFEGSEDFEGWGKDYGFITGVGDNRIRAKISETVSTKSGSLVNVIHPAASIADGVSLSVGIFIARNVSISPLAVIGADSILNTACVVEHECRIGKGVHIAPGAVLAGNVTVGDYSFIGANAVVKQGVTIGANVMVGAGAVVLNDTGDGETWVGNPAKRIR